MDFSKEDYCLALPFLGDKIIAYHFLEIYIIVSKDLEPRNGGFFEGHNEQFVLLHTLCVVIIKHFIHVFNVLVQISSLVITI